MLPPIEHRRLTNMMMSPLPEDLRKNNRAISQCSFDCAEHTLYQKPL